MKRTVLSLRRAFGTFQYYMSMVAGVITFVMMWLIDVNAVARKAINTPVPGGIEITQSLLTFSIMLPFGYVLFRGEHVNTVVLTSRLSHRTNHWLHVFWMTTGALLFAAVTYGAWIYAIRSYNMNEQVWGATIRFAVWPAKMAVAFGALLLSFQFALDALVALLTDGEGDLSNPVPDPEKALHHV